MDIGRRNNQDAYALGPKITSMLTAFRHALGSKSPKSGQLGETRYRKNGFVVVDQENEIEGRRMGAPIFDYMGKPKSAISVSGLVIRLSSEKIRRLGPK